MRAGNAGIGVAQHVMLQQTEKPLLRTRSPSITNRPDIYSKRGSTPNHTKQSNHPPHIRLLGLNNAVRGPGGDAAAWAHYNDLRVSTIYCSSSHTTSHLSSRPPLQNPPPVPSYPSSPLGYSSPIPEPHLSNHTRRAYACYNVTTSTPSLRRPMMCIRCTGGTSAIGRTIIGDGYTQRHTVPLESYGPVELERRSLLRARRRDPGPIVHPSVRALRSHRRKFEDPCELCEAYDQTPDYWQDYWTQTLDTVNRKIQKELQEREETGDADEELLAYYMRRRNKLERQLSGEKEERTRRQVDEPLAEAILVKLTVRQKDALDQIAEERETSRSVLIRQAVDSFLVL